VILFADQVGAHSDHLSVGPEVWWFLAGHSLGGLENAVGATPCVIPLLRLASRYGARP
jgi:hypothetical protein